MTVYAHADIYTESNGRPLRPIPAGTPGELVQEFTPNPEGPNLVVVAFGSRRAVVRENSLVFEMPF